METIENIILTALGLALAYCVSLGVIAIACAMSGKPAFGYALFKSGILTVLGG